MSKLQENQYVEKENDTVNRVDGNQNDSGSNVSETKKTESNDTNAKTATEKVEMRVIMQTLEMDPIIIGQQLHMKSSRWILIANHSSLPQDGTDTTQNQGEKEENINNTEDESIWQNILLEKAQNPSTVVRHRLDRWVDLD
ncbi:hypothetical protein TorRG33x02_106650 [Trema orientale]|uniref:Uncharacterized protein n=1 Tax=Trema orientale TaxID=63057 RepID=A0A2P5F7C4_TREOI|nr:hypothetical protein TorRG33x02_106650 [Trema orientale]